VKTIKFLLKGFGVFVALILLVSLVLYISTGGDYKVAKTVEQDPSIPHVVLDGTTFHAETFGDPANPPVVAIHGGPGNDYRMLLPLKGLSDEFYVIFYDQRGTGLSPRVDPEELTLESSLTDLELIVDHFSGERKVNLIGHSWGAILASGFLARHPEKVDHIVLAEPGALTSETAKSFMAKVEPEFSLKMLFGGIKLLFQSLHIDGPDDQAKMDWFFMTFPFLDIGDNPLAGYFCNGDPKTASLDMWRFSFQSSISIMGEMVTKVKPNGDPDVDMVSGVEKFGGKVLFLTSECNTLIGVEHQKNHIKHFPNAEQVIIKGSGHTMFGEKPEESLAAVRAYFNAPQ
jgi:proline iminopeptidase